MLSPYATRIRSERQPEPRRHALRVRLTAVLRPAITAGTSTEGSAMNASRTLSSVGTMLLLALLVPLAPVLGHRKLGDRWRRCRRCPHLCRVTSAPHLLVSRSARRRLALAPGHAYVLHGSIVNEGSVGGARRRRRSSSARRQPGRSRSGEPPSAWQVTTPSATAFGSGCRVRSTTARMRSSHAPDVRGEAERSGA